VRIRPGRGAGVRRWAEQVRSGQDGDVATLRYSDPEGLASWLVGYGADVVVLDPPEVRDAAVARLRRIVAVHDDAPGRQTPPSAPAASRARGASPMPGAPTEPAEPAGAGVPAPEGAPGGPAGSRHGGAAKAGVA
jgi:hypothetical protein